ncbi:MAG: methionyl-tRNA formyltransferase [Lachnospiraceae bacterium]|nr:methionyl-tRNA formyltransferase [Lachnospiraceae bacterium]
MGTPDFAVSALKALVADGHEVVCAVTQPDKPKGRGKKMQFPPVKEAAQKAGIPVEQPQRVRGNEEFLAKMEALRPDVIVVAAYGQILPQRLLDIPACGCINIHASLLPKYRGASPIQNAILAGETVTGITTMRMDAGLDTGDIIEQREIPIAADETGGSLHDRLAELGGELILSTLKKIGEGTAQYAKQDDAAATHCGKIAKQTGALDFTKSAAELERQIRALDPWPGTFTCIGDRNIKVWSAEVSAEDNVPENNVGDGQNQGRNQSFGTTAGADAKRDGTAIAGADAKQEDGADSGSESNPEIRTGAEEKTPGEVVGFGFAPYAKDRILVQTGDGILAIRELQPEGKRRMAADAYLRGYPVELHARLG